MKPCIAFVGLCAALVCAPALAENYPDKPVTIVVPFAVGGPTDASARIVATALAKDCDANFVVVNVPGAGATIGATRVAQAKPDGYTLLWGSGSTLAMTPHLYSNLKYDPVTSFAPVGLVVAQPFVLVVRPSLGVKTLAEFIKLAKASPGKLNFSSTGLGASSHLVATLFEKETGVVATHVPYNGGAPAMNAVIAGDVDFYFDTPTTIAPMVKAGRLVALAVTSTKRIDDLPDVPTLRESGLPKFDATTWFGVVAPAGTPRDRVDYLAKHLGTVLKQASVVASLRSGGFEIETLSPDDFAQKIAAESARWGATIREAGIKLD